MAKRIMCKPQPEIELCIEGGPSVVLRFDVNTLMEIQNLEGGLQGLFKKSIPEMVATLIYAGAHVKDENYTLEDARKMVSFMSVGDITALVEEFSSSMGVTKNEMNEDMAKNLMAQFLSVK